MHMYEHGQQAPPDDPKAKCQLGKGVGYLDILVDIDHMYL